MLASRRRVQTFGTYSRSRRKCRWIYQIILAIVNEANTCKSKGTKLVACTGTGNHNKPRVDNVAAVARVPWEQPQSMFIRNKLYNRRMVKLTLAKVSRELREGKKPDMARRRLRPYACGTNELGAGIYRCLAKHPVYYKSRFTRRLRQVGYIGKWDIFMSGLPPEFRDT